MPIPIYTIYFLIFFAGLLIGYVLGIMRSDREIEELEHYKRIVDEMCED